MKLLLDVHIAKATIPALRKLAPNIDAEHISEWHGGALRQAGDDEILTACYKDGRLFLTFDQATVPDLLRRWIAEEKPHSGVLFGDENTVRPNAPSQVASAIVATIKDLGEADTTNLVRYLQKAR